MEKLLGSSNPIENFYFINISAPKLKAMENLFYYIGNKIKFENVDISSVTTMKNMIRNINYNKVGEFYFKNINASNILELVGVSNYLTGFCNITFENINFSKLTSMENMFMEEIIGNVY